MDFVKIAVALCLYAAFAPLLGVWLARARVRQRATFAAMMAMTALRPGNFTFMIGSIETYRGHAKGFEVSMLEVLSIALVVAAWLEARRSTGAPLERRRVPGLGLYWLWCGIAALTAIGGLEPSYAMMAAVRFFKGGLLYLAAALCLRDEDDLRWAVGGMAAALAHHGLLAMKMRVLDGAFQVKGWFEHQNPMAMWCYLGALPVFAVALRPETRGRLLALCLAGVGGAGLAILASVSRAALAAFAAGAALLLLVALARRPGRRAFAMLAVAAAGAVVVAAVGLDSFKARLNEVKSSAEVVEEDLRDILNRQSAAMLADHPWMGVGWNHFGILNSRPRGDRYSEILEEWDRERGFTIHDENYWANPLTESLYWLWLAETGWLGFGGFVLFLFATLVLTARASWRHRRTLAGAFAMGLLVALAICYLHGTVERILTQPKNLSQWLLLAGLGAGLARTKAPLRRRLS
jgi:O-antigen ligase